MYDEVISKSQGSHEHYKGYLKGQTLFNAMFSANVLQIKRRRLICEQLKTVIALSYLPTFVFNLIFQKKENTSILHT